ncbi:MAG: hypothetical protein ABIH59_00525 [archaeon]
MAQLTISQLIKIIIGILVFVVVVAGVYFFFKNQVIGFFQNMIGGNETGLIWSLLK